MVNWDEVNMMARDVLYKESRKKEKELDTLRKKLYASDNHNKRTIFYMNVIDILISYDSSTQHLSRYLEINRFTKFKSVLLWVYTSISDEKIKVSDILNLYGEGFRWDDNILNNSQIEKYESDVSELAFKLSVDRK